MSYFKQIKEISRKWWIEASNLIKKIANHLVKDNL